MGGKGNSGWVVISRGEGAYNFLLRETQQHVFRLEIGVDDLAEPVQEVQSDEDLLGYDASEVHRNSLVAVALDNLEQIHSEDLEYHAKVVSVGPPVDEAVQQLNNLAVVSREEFLRLILRRRRKKYIWILGFAFFGTMVSRTGALNR